jgi:hypothetical protein
MNAEKWDTPNPRFIQWWDEDACCPANPFEKGSPAFWAWEGWQAALSYNVPKAEDKKCT